VNRWIKRAVIGGAIILAIIMVAVGGLYWFLRSGCKDSKKEVVFSPDGAWKAVAYHRDCGVFGDSSAVYVAPSGRWWPRSSDYVFGSDGHVYLSISWTDAHHLTIVHDRGLATDDVTSINKREEIGPVKIAYKELR
jgi:hypothetical protein